MNETKRTPKPKIVERKCRWCRKPFFARAVDVKRGWGLFCSKSCKAKKQEKRTGQHNEYLNNGGFPGEMSEWERREIQHERDLYESTSSHGQDNTGGA